MSKRSISRMPIEARILAARVAIDNALDDAEILARLTELGYNESKLQQGKALYETVDALQKKQEILWKTTAKETQKRGIAFVKYFLREVVPSIDPMMVEKELWADLPGIGVKLKGVIDLVEKDFCLQPRSEGGPNRPRHPENSHGDPSS